MNLLYPLRDDRTWYYRFDSCGESVYIVQYYVDRETPKGVWLVDDIGRERWVGHSWARKPAHATLEEARSAFIRRKYAAINHAYRRLEDQKKALGKIESTYIHFKEKYDEGIALKAERLEKKLCQA